MVVVIVVVGIEIDCNTSRNLEILLSKDADSELGSMCRETLNAHGVTDAIHMAALDFGGLSSVRIGNSSGEDF